MNPHLNSNLNSAHFFTIFDVMVYHITPKHVSPLEFITFWQQLYNYGNEETYRKVISKPELMPDDITVLFHWKNNMGKGEDRLSGSKKVFVQEVLARIDRVNQLKKSFDLDQYMECFHDLPAIWGTTLLHVVSSSSYPIYDQHVHRAFTYCSNGTVEEIPVSNVMKYKVYRQDYVPGLNSIDRINDELQSYL